MAGLHFHPKCEMELRQWVEANPEHVNGRDMEGYTPLYTASCYMESLPLTEWLLDEKGADVNDKLRGGFTSLHGALSHDILNALLDRRADPTLRNGRYERSAFMVQAGRRDVKLMARLLQDLRVRASIDMRDWYGYTALHLACCSRINCADEDLATSAVHTLLQAGANPTTISKDGETALAVLRKTYPAYDTTIALLGQALDDTEKTSLLVKTRYIVGIAPINTTTTPSYLRGRQGRGEPLPRMALTPATGANARIKGGHRKLRSMLGFILGMRGGANGEGLPWDVFRMVLDLLMPIGDPMRKALASHNHCKASIGEGPDLPSTSAAAVETLRLPVDP